MENNKTLRSLKLSGNNIGDEGAKALVDALTNNKTLTILVLNGNVFSDEIERDITNKLERNAKTQLVPL